jgi:S-adenosylmethionine:tRNA ribosyltransferase-isomerase
MARYTLSDFDYALPPQLIAQTPAPRRSGSRLLHVDGGTLADFAFADLERLLARGDLVVFNDTRVVKARLFAVRPTGGKVELLLERAVSSDEAIFQLRASHPPGAGGELSLPGGARATVIGRDGRFFHLRLEGIATVFDYLERHGEIPLPPYIARAPGADDDARYQTVFARHSGAAAAPTAGLHFDDTMFATLAAAGVRTAFVTLHVGAGTFQPVDTEDLALHRMHAEWYRIPPETVAAIAEARARGGRVVAVGTTTLRALESAAGDDGDVRAGDAETRLFVTPGYRFRVVDRLLTNFHLPKSTLLMLVSAFAGYDVIRRAYAHAIAARYRFYSYGDAMLLERASAESIA